MYLTALVGLLAWRLLPDPLPAEWTPEQRALIQSLSLSRLPATPGDPSNAVAESELAAQLGHRLYFDQRLSGNGEVACANCHQPKNYFTDDRTLAVGTQTGFRHTPSLVGLAYSLVLLGRPERFTVGPPSPRSKPVMNTIWIDCR